MTSRPFVQAASGASQHTPVTSQGPEGPLVKHARQGRVGCVALFIRGTCKEQDTNGSDVNKDDEEDGVEREDDDGMVE